MKEQIQLKYKDICIPVTLNDTAAAKEFFKRLPVEYAGKRLKDNYCFCAPIGCYDPQETQAGWKNGDISLARGHFRILFDGEEESSQYTGLMVIGHLEEKQRKMIQEFPETLRLKIEVNK
jgi:Domain of unknown function (DUF369).